MNDAHDAVRTSEHPDDTLLEFLQTTYDAAANLGRWDRDALERRIGNSRNAREPEDRRP